MRGTFGPRELRLVLGCCLAVACGGDDESPPVDPAGDTVAAVQPAAWQVLPVAAPSGFRAFGWAAGDSLWGIARGNLALATLSGDSVRLPVDAWAAGTAPGLDLVWWTDQDGVRVRRGLETSLPVPVTEAPSPEHTGPDVLWAPDGTRALLTWIAESGPVHSVTGAGEHRLLQRTHVPGYMLGTGALWIDSTRVLVHATAHAPLSGPAEHRESGYRGDLAVIDVAYDTAYVITAAADGQYLRTEGLLAPDTVLVGVHTGAGWPSRHVALHVASRTAVPRLHRAGRARASHGLIALLRPVAATGAEPAWELEIIDAPGSRAALGPFTGHDIRLLWHPARRMLAVAQESEIEGYRTVVFRGR